MYQPTDDIAFSMTNSVMAADTYFPITYKVDILDDIFRVASVVWIIVSLAILLMLVVTYFTTIYEIKDSNHLKDNIYRRKLYLLQCMALQNLKSFCPPLTRTAMLN